MLLRGCFLAAKKVAVALDTLIRTQYPRDHLTVIGFAYYAREIRPGALAELTWHGYEYGTNLQHGLLLARRILARQAAANKEIVVITDGEPTAHFEDGQVEFSYPPTRRTINETLREVQRCTKEGITINTFMLERSRALAEFVAHMTRLNRGRAFYAEPEHLGEYVLVDFVGRRTRRASYRSTALRPAADTELATCRLRRPAVPWTALHTRQETTDRCPTSRPRPPTSSTRSAPAAHLDGERLVIDDEAAFRDDGHPRPRLDRGVQRRTRRRPRRPSGSSGRPARSSVRRVGQHPGAVRRPAAAARSVASRSRPSTCGRRPSTWPGPSSRRPRPPTSARSSSSSPAASRPTRSSARSTTRRASWPGRSPPAGAARSSSRATTTSSTPRSTRPTRRR